MTLVPFPIQRRNSAGFHAWIGAFNQAPSKGASNAPQILEFLRDYAYKL